MPKYKTLLHGTNHNYYIRSRTITTHSTSTIQINVTGDKLDRGISTISVQYHVFRFKGKENMAITQRHIGDTGSPVLVALLLPCCVRDACLCLLPFGCARACWVCMHACCVGVLVCVCLRCRLLLGAGVALADTRHARLSRMELQHDWWAIGGYEYLKVGFLATLSPIHVHAPSLSFLLT